MQKGFTVWFTGLPSSGKSTIAELLFRELKSRGIKVELFDGDIVRENLSKGLGFSKEDRDINIKRIAFVCDLLARNDVGAIAAAISPYREVRDYARNLIKNFIEVYVKCPVEICIRRDVKGLYKKALAGEIKGFTGIDDPYEEPLNPELILETDKETPEESFEKILIIMEEKNYLQPKNKM